MFTFNFSPIIFLNSLSSLVFVTDRFLFSANCYAQFFQIFLNWVSSSKPSLPLCSCQYAFIDLRLPNQGITRLQKKWKSKYQPLPSGNFKSYQIPLCLPDSL